MNALLLLSKPPLFILTANVTFPSSANDICPFQRPFHDEHWIQHVFSGIAVDLSSRIKIPTSIVFEILLSRRRNLVRGGQFCFARAVRSVIGGAVMEKKSIGGLSDTVSRHRTQRSCTSASSSMESVVAVLDLTTIGRSGFESRSDGVRFAGSVDVNQNCDLKI